MCTRCGWRQGSGLMRKAHVCLGDTDRAAYLHGSLSMSGSCAHCPLGCHPFEERETLMGTKGSSKGKFLLQAGQRSLQSKKSLWFCIWHIYAPFLLGTGLKDFWLDLNFQKEKYLEIEIHVGIKETREMQEVSRYSSGQKVRVIAFPSRRGGINQLLLLKSQCLLSHISTQANSSHQFKMCDQ